MPIGPDKLIESPKVSCAPSEFDRLAPIFARVQLRARIFQAGQLCNSVDFAPQRGGHVHMLRAGSLSIETGADAPRVLTAPSMVFLPRPMAHRLIPHDPAIDLVCAEIDLGGPGNPLEASLPDLTIVSLTPAGGLWAVLTLLFAEADNPNCGNQAVLDRLAEIVVIQLLRHLIATGSSHAGVLAGLAHPAIGRLLTRLHEDPGYSWTLEHMAEVAGMSRSSLAETFRKTVGTPPGDYLREWRLNLARTRLARGEPLKRITRDVGYGSSAALSRALGLSWTGSARRILTGS